MKVEPDPDYVAVDIKMEEQVEELGFHLAMAQSRIDALVEITGSSRIDPTTQGQIIKLCFHTTRLLKETG